MTAPRRGAWPAAIVLAAVVTLAVAAAPAARADGVAGSPSTADPIWVGVVDTEGGLVLVGRAGQVVRPAGPVRWQRVAGGGVGPDLVAAAWRGDVVIGLPRQAPMFRFDGISWHSSRVGQSGKLLAGTGPASTLAIGRHLFGFRDGKWLRLAFAPEAVRASWAGPRGELAMAGAAGLYWQRGKRLVKVGPGPAAAIVGTRAWAWAPSGLIALGRPAAPTPTGKAPARRPIPAPGAVVAAATSRDGRGLVVVDDGRVVRLVVLTDVAAPVVLESPIRPGTAVGGVGADADRLVVVAGPVVHVHQAGAWSIGEVVAAAAAPGRTGPGPARTR